MGIPIPIPHTHKLNILLVLSPFQIQITIKSEEKLTKFMPHLSLSLVRHKRLVTYKYDLLECLVSFSQ